MQSPEHIVRDAFAYADALDRGAAMVAGQCTWSEYRVADKETVNWHKAREGLDAGRRVEACAVGAARLALEEGYFWKAYALDFIGMPKSIPSLNDVDGLTFSEISSLIRHKAREYATANGVEL